MFQIGDSIVCVENTFETDSNLFNSLTLGKKYIVTAIYNNNDFLNVVSDKRVEQRYWVKRFVPLTEVRKYKLNKIWKKTQV
jgi:hypothetical protein